MAGTWVGRLQWSSKGLYIGSSANVCGMLWNVSERYACKLLDSSPEYCALRNHLITSEVRLAGAIACIIADLNVRVLFAKWRLDP